MSDDDEIGTEDSDSGAAVWIIGVLLLAALVAVAVLALVRR